MRHSRLDSRLSLPSRLSRWRPARPLAAALAAVLLVVAGGTAAAMDKRVLLDVDGEQRTVHTVAATVAEALAAAGVELDEHDAVAPEPHEELARGEVVMVRHARPFILTLDGETEDHWVNALTVGEALDQLGLGEEALALSAQRGDAVPADGMEVEARSAKRVVVLRDRVRIEEATVAETVEELLAAHRIEPGEHDIVAPDPETELDDGTVVSVLELLSEPVTEEVEIKAEMEEQENGELERGERNVIEEPEDGLKEVTTALVRMDGEETEHTLAEEVIREPVDGLVEVGTMEPEADPDLGGDVDSLNWAALASCESNGNPAAVNSAGGYYGLYQFGVAAWKSVGGSGLPSDAPADEQTMRAKMLYEQVGGNWQGQWPTCGSRLFE